MDSRLNQITSFMSQICQNKHIKDWSIDFDQNHAELIIYFKEGEKKD